MAIAVAHKGPTPRRLSRRLATKSALGQLLNRACEHFDSLIECNKVMVQTRKDLPEKIRQPVVYIF
jgi:hypothetical protein